MISWLRSIIGKFDCPYCGTVKYPEKLAPGVKLCKNCRADINKPITYCSYCNTVPMYNAFGHGPPVGYCKKCIDAINARTEELKNQLECSVSPSQKETTFTASELESTRMRDMFSRLLQISYYGMYSPGNHSMDDVEIQRLINALGEYFIKMQLPNNIQIATDSINILKTTTNIDTFFSRVDVCHRSIRGWWADDIFFEEVERQKIRLLNDVK